MSGLAQQGDAIRPGCLSVEAAPAGCHRYFQQLAGPGYRDVKGAGEVGAIRKGRVVRAAVPPWIARISAPIDARGDGTVHAISLVKQHGCITTIESPTPGTMTGHLLIKPVFEQAGEGLDLLLHHRFRVLNQVGVKPEIMAR